VFAGFLRFDEAVHIRACEEEITQERARLFCHTVRTTSLHKEVKF